MKRSRWVAAWLPAMLMCHAAWANVDGRRVSDVLDELRSAGLTFIYSNQLVPSDMRIRGEPQATAGLELAREILIAQGLGISPVAPGVYAVVPGNPAVDTQPPRDRAESPPGNSVIGEVVVQTSRYTVAADNIVSQTFLTQEQVKSMPRLADETLRVLERLPGMTTNGFSSIGSVRGGEANETSIVLDGLRLYEPFHLKDFLAPVSLLDSRVIDGFEFYSGGFPVIYGDRMSAIIDATTVRPDLSHYYEAGLSFFHASALAAVDFADGRGHALASARRSNVGDLAQFAENDFGKPNYDDLFARADWRFSDSTTGSFDALRSSDSIVAVQAADTQRAIAKYHNLYAWGTLDHEWSERARSRVIVSYTGLTNEREGSVDDPGRRTGEVHDERRFHIVGLRAENELESGSLAHRFGAEVRRLWGRYDYSSAIQTAQDFPLPGSPPMSTVRSATPHPHGFETSGYWDARASLGDRWAIHGGMRIDTQTYDGSDDGAQWSPRISALYSAGPRTQWRATWGRFYQAQAINEMQVEDGVDRFHGAQYADHAIVSLEHAFSGGFDLRLEAFHKDYHHVAARFENLFDPVTLFPEAQFDRVMIDADGSEAAGIEAMLRMSPHGAWSGWLGYSWSRVSDEIDGKDVPRSWDQPSAVTLGIVWASGPWTVTFASNYHTGWPTTELAVALDGNGVPQLDTSRRNRGRFAYYNSVDFRITRTFAMPRGALDVFLEASNALDHRNPCCAEYEFRQAPDGSTTVVKDIDMWLPVIPSLGVLWRYGPDRR